MTQDDAEVDRGAEFQEFLWSLLDDANRRRLVQFDDHASAMSVADRISLSAAAYHITFLCDELEDPQAGFEQLLDRLRREDVLPPNIPFFAGYPGAAAAVACLSSYDGYGGPASIAVRKAVAQRLLQRVG